MEILTNTEHIKVKLQKGNILQYEHYDGGEIKQFVFVYEILETEIRFKTQSGTKCGVALSLELFKPIPLTKEWLVKFDFYKRDWAEDIVYENQFPLLKDGDAWKLIDNDFIGLKNIEFVHQLQNLYFALTDEELILKA